MPGRKGNMKKVSSRDSAKRNLKRENAKTSKSTKAR